MSTCFVVGNDADGYFLRRSDGRVGVFVYASRAAAQAAADERNFWDRASRERWSSVPSISDSARQYLRAKNGGER